MRESGVLCARQHSSSTHFVGSAEDHFMSNQAEATETNKTKRNANALMLFLGFCVAVPAILFLAGNGRDLLAQVRAILGF